MTDLVTWLNANQGFAISLRTLIYVLATVVIVIVQIRANRLSAKNIETIVSLEKERTRPSLLFRLEPRDHGFVFVSVRNIGESTAFDVEIEVAPEPKRDVDGREGIRFLQEGIASLPPGGELSTLVCRFEELKRQCDELFFEGEVKYRRRDGTIYEEPFKIDLSAHEDLLHFEENTVHDVAKLLKKFRRDFRKLLRGSKSISVSVDSEPENQE